VLFDALNVVPVVKVPDTGAVPPVDPFPLYVTMYELGVHCAISARFAVLE
jgi:hypothetical protein